MPIKTIYCIQHGLALHNILFKRIGRDAYTKYRDTELVKKGIHEAQDLGNNWDQLNNIELVMVSPCARTLNTAKYIFRSRPKLPMLAFDFLIEHSLGGDEICNQRKNINDLKKAFPEINFDMINNNVLEWPLERETIQQLDSRIQEMFEFIRLTPEKTIAIVSHSSFIGRFKDKFMGNEDNELLHCHPYKLLLHYDDDYNFIKMESEEENIIL